MCTILIFSSYFVGLCPRCNLYSHLTLGLPQPTPRLPHLFLNLTCLIRIWFFQLITLVIYVGFELCCLLCGTENALEFSTNDAGFRNSPVQIWRELKQKLLLLCNYLKIVRHDQLVVFVLLWTTSRTPSAIMQCGAVFYRWATKKIDATERKNLCAFCTWSSRYWWWYFLWATLNRTQQ